MATIADYYVGRAAWQPSGQTAGMPHFPVSPKVPTAPSAGGFGLPVPPLAPPPPGVVADDPPIRAAEPARPVRYSAPAGPVGIHNRPRPAGPDQRRTRGVSPCRDGDCSCPGGSCKETQAGSKGSAELNAAFDEIAHKLPLGFPRDKQGQQARYCTTFAYPMSLMRSTNRQTRRRGQMLLLDAIKRAPCDKGVFATTDYFKAPPRPRREASPEPDDEPAAPFAPRRAYYQYPTGRPIEGAGSGCRPAWDEIDPHSDPHHPHWRTHAPSEEVEQSWRELGWLRRPVPGASPDGGPRWTWTGTPQLLRRRPLICDEEGEQDTIVPPVSPRPPPHPESHVIVNAPHAQGSPPQATPAAAATSGVPDQPPFAIPPTPQASTYPAPGPFPTSGFQPFAGASPSRPYGDDPESGETIATSELTVHYEEQGRSWSAYQV